MSGQKEIAYYYDSKLVEKETELDMDGDMLVPEYGEVLERPDGERWKVVMVIAVQTGKALPVHKVYLVRG